MKTPIAGKIIGLFCGSVLGLLDFSSASAAAEQIVIDDLTPSQLRTEIKKIQTEFYRVFNAANEDPDLEIVCHTYVPTSSHIKREACEPQFVIDKRGQNATDARLFVDALLDANGLQKELTAEFAKLTEAMNALAAENSYFKELNSILGMLRGRLDELTQ